MKQLTKKDLKSVVLNEILFGESSHIIYGIIIPVGECIRDKEIKSGTKPYKCRKFAVINECGKTEIKYIDPDGYITLEKKGETFTVERLSDKVMFGVSKSEEDNKSYLNMVSYKTEVINEVDCSTETNYSLHDMRVEVSNDIQYMMILFVASHQPPIIRIFKDENIKILDLFSGAGSVFSSLGKEIIVSKKVIKDTSQKSRLMTPKEKLEYMYTGLSISKETIKYNDEGEIISYSNPINEITYSESFGTISAEEDEELETELKIVKCGDIVMKADYLEYKRVGQYQVKTIIGGINYFIGQFTAWHNQNVTPTYSFSNYDDHFDQITYMRNMNGEEGEVLLERYKNLIMEWRNTVGDIYDKGSGSREIYFPDSKNIFMYITTVGNLICTTKCYYENGDIRFEYIQDSSSRFRSKSNIQFEHCMDLGYLKKMMNSGKYDDGISPSEIEVYSYKDNDIVMTFQLIGDKSILLEEKSELPISIDDKDQDGYKKRYIRDCFGIPRMVSFIPAED